MHSPKPKVLQTILGEPMLAYVLKALEPIFSQNIFIVAGHCAEEVISRFPEHNFTIQKEQLGTGHAVLSAMEALEKNGSDLVLVINGDTPLVSTDIISGFMAGGRNADIAFATITLKDPGSYGRVIRADGKIQAIVEARDYDAQVHGAMTGEVNAGMYLLRVSALRELLPLVRNANKSGEYYITDLIGLGVERHMDVRGIQCGSNMDLLGVNSPLELSRMEEALRARMAEALLARGIIIHAPDLLRASPFAVIEPGAEITAPCEIYGNSRIASGAIIESHCVIHDSDIAANAIVHSFSHLDGARVGEETRVGPFARLRPGADLEKEAHVGNFVELKKTRLGAGSKANHLTYLGDTEVGAHVNIGAGTITCNYDGKNKFRTSIGDGAFIGSNTSLVAPVEVGENSLVGAGSVITHAVPANDLGIARAKQKNLPRKIR